MFLRPLDSQGGGGVASRELLSPHCAMQKLHQTSKKDDRWRGTDGELWSTDGIPSATHSTWRHPLPGALHRRRLPIDRRAVQSGAAG